KVVVPPITNGYGLLALIMQAKLNGGGETNIDPGFEAMIDRIGPNVLTYEPSSGKLSELFQSGDVALAVWGSSRAKALAGTGFPAGFVYPKEGAVALMAAVCPVVDSDVPDLAQSFIRYLVSAEVQAKLAEATGFGPVNKNTKLSPELENSVPFGPEKVGKMVSVDYSIVNKQRQEWTKRWNRQVE
ncbi:MAG: extracellular solute-binding protein, partial [Gammaproteobacteria bacterium]|nr:extracellular solute-binding protein [Gammaproteobacteria bacterium]